MLIKILSRWFTRIEHPRSNNTSMELNFLKATSMHFNLMTKTATSYGKAAINTEIDQMINEFKAFCIIKDGKFLSADYKKL